MAGEIIRVDVAQVKINRPDGSTIEYSGPADELSIILSQLDRPRVNYAQLLQWSTQLQKFQPLILTALFAVVSVGLLLWVLRPAPAIQPQSQGVSHAVLG